MGEALVNHFMNSNPAILALYNHISAGGDPQEFFKNQVLDTDYSKLSIDNDAAKESIIIEKLTRVNNMSAEEAKDMVTLMKANGTLDTKSKQAQEDLVRWVNDNKKAEEENTKAAIEAQKIAAKETREKIRNVIEVGKIHNVEIPAKDKSSFYEFLTKEVEPGVRKADKAYDALSLEQKLMVEYLVCKEMNIDDLVKIKAEQQKVDLIKSKTVNKPIVLANGNIKKQQSKEQFSLAEVI